MFRNSLFGFKKDDVLSYISKSNNQAKLRESELEAVIDEKECKIKELSECLEAAEKVNLEISRKLAEFESKQHELTVMSENIGRLYLVAKTSAAAVMKNAEESSRLIKEEIETNLENLEGVKELLNDLGAKINLTASKYAEEVESYSMSVDDMKIILNNNNENTKKAIEDYQNIANNI